MLTKKCPRCHKEVSIADFYDNAAYCIPCHKEYNKEQYAKNKEQNKNKHKKARREAIANCSLLIDRIQKDAEDGVNDADHYSEMLVKIIDNIIDATH